MTDPTQANSPDRPYTFDRVFRLAISAATLIGVFWLMQFLSPVLIPFFVALLIAYLLNPIVNVFESRLNRRGLAVAITLVGCFVVLFALVVLIVPLAGSQLTAFKNLVAELRIDSMAEAPVTGSQGAHDSIESRTLSQRFDAFIANQNDERAVWILTRIRDFVRSEDFDPEKYLIEIGRKLAPGVWGVVTGTLSFLLGLTGLMLILLYVVFLLSDFRLVEQHWKEHLPPSFRDPFVSFVDEFHDAMAKYFRGQFVIAAIVGVLFAIGFSLIGLRLGILLGLGIGALNMVPYLQLVGAIPALLLGVIRAVEHDSSVVVSLLLVVFVFGVVQTIQDAILTPRILGKTTGLRPAVILLGLCIWGRLLGVLGLVLAIPLTCLGLVYYRRLILARAAG